MNNFLNNFINLNDELTATMILVGLSISFIHGLIISKLYLKTYYKLDINSPKKFNNAHLIHTKT